MLDLRSGGFKGSVKFLAAFATTALLVAACDSGEAAWRTQADAASADSTAEAGYLAPPQVTASRAGPGDAVLVEGTAAPGARVRLAPPRAEPIFATADGEGRWRASLPVGEPVRLFGLSMIDEGRAAQAEGYLMLTAEGRAVQLRAGAGAVSRAPASRSPRILAVDYDRDGGAVVSGVAEPGVALGLRVDRARRGETKADPRGRFSISLTEPLAPGVHEIEVSGQSGEDTLRAEMTPAGEIGAGPYVGRRTPFGWRVDWMPPGGGVQTTLIFERPAA
jgi:hypothetical protein